MPLSPDERQQLEDILWAMDRGLSASEAQSAFQSVMSANASRVAAARQGKQELLGQIGQTGLEAATSGVPENDLAAIIHSMQAISPVNTGQNWNERVGQVLAPLYGRTGEAETWTVKGGFPAQSFEELTQGMPGGISPLADIGFDESDVRAITSQTQMLKAQGLKMPEIQAAIYQQLTVQVDPVTGEPAMDPVTGAPLVDEAGQEFVGQFGGLIDQAVRNAYMAAGPVQPAIREPGAAEAATPTGATGPLGPAGAGGPDIGLPEILATGAGIQAGRTLAQGLRAGAAPYGGGATGFLRGALPGLRGGARAAEAVSNVPNPALLTEAIPGVTRAPSSSGGVLSFLRALSGHFGIFPDYLPPNLVEPLEDPYAPRPA